MRHRKQTKKLGRSSSHRKALLAAMICNFIEYRRVKTTLAKAKLTRSVAEKMVTLAKKGTLAARRRAVAFLHRKPYVAKLFEQIAPAFADRAGGYTRIVKLGRRVGDNSEMALLEWVGLTPIVRKKKPRPEKGKKDEGDKKPEKPEKPEA